MQFFRRITLICILVTQPKKIRVVVTRLSSTCADAEFYASSLHLRILRERRDDDATRPATHKMCLFFIFVVLFLTFFTWRRQRRDVCIHANRSARARHSKQYASIALQTAAFTAYVTVKKAETGHIGDDHYCERPTALIHLRCYNFTVVVHQGRGDVPHAPELGRLRVLGDLEIRIPKRNQNVCRLSVRRTSPERIGMIEDRGVV